MGEEAEYTVKYIDGGGEEEEEEVVRLSCYFLSYVFHPCMLFILLAEMDQARG